MISEAIKADNAPLITVRRAGKSFITKDGKVLRAFHGVNLDIPEGEFLALVGPSGCGKSTLLNVLAGLTKLTTGEALLAGRKPGESKLDVGYVFQQDSVLPWLKVRDNIELGLKLRGWSPDRRRQTAEALITKIGLDGFAEAYPTELSGGMRKRVALATALAYDSKVLFMDEPFGALDAQTRIVLQDELLRLWQEQRQTIVFVTHDIGEAIAMADRVVVMTARPARIKSIYTVDLPRPRIAAEVRFHPKFDELYRAVWQDLRPEMSAQSDQERPHEH